MPDQPIPSTPPEPAFVAAPLEPHEIPEALELAEAAGVHGVYVRNGLLGAGLEGPDGGDAPSERSTDGATVLALRGAERLLGVAWFGGRGNLIVHTRVALQPNQLAKALLEQSDWRIALGPEWALGQVARRDVTAPLVFRQQHYYAAREPGPCREVARVDARLAVRRDVEALVRAALDLNQSDLRVAPWRVNRAWLRESIRERIRNERTWVLGPPGKPDCKLDLGSTGPAGSMVEGVYTFPHARGRGLGAGLVARICADQLEEGAPVVCLHVDARNEAAIRAYMKAGMAFEASCHLLLRG